jgi:hypothetical protein
MSQVHRYVNVAIVDFGVCDGDIVIELLDTAIESTIKTVTPSCLRGVSVRTPSVRFFVLFSWAISCTCVFRSDLKISLGMI